jgi:hypothetical protein
VAGEGVLSRSRRLLTAGAVALAALGLVAQATTAASASRPKHLKCDLVLPFSTVTHEILIDTGIAPQVTLKAPFATKFSEWPDGPTGLRGANIYSSGCYDDWTNAMGNASAYDADLNSPDTAPNMIVWVGSGATRAEFRNIRAEEAKAPGTDTDAVSGVPYNAQRNVSLGDHSQGFVESFNLAGPTGNKYPTDYGLYVLSKHHNLITFWGWPLSLPQEEKLVQSALASNKF